MRSANQIRYLTAPAIFATALTLAACGGPPPPTTEIQHARDAIARAEDDGAAQLASSPLASAQSKLARAQSAVNNDNALARRMAEQSEVDAEYADAYSRAQRTENTANELQQAASQRR